MNKIFPVRRAINQPQLTSTIDLVTLRQTARSNIAQQMMNLIDSQHGRGGIVDGGRKRFRRDINDNAKRIRRILLQSTLLTESDRPQESFLRNSFATVKDAEEGIA